MYNNKEIPQTIHDSPEFKKLLETLLTDYAKLQKHHVDMITSPDNMKKFEIAFTHPTFDSQNNYEFYEFIGDLTVNKSIVWYLQRRFPSLRNEKGVETFSQLKANLVSRKSLSSLAIKLDFWQFVRMSVEIQERNKIKVMEDIFEAFMGCLESVVDETISIHAGYGVCYTIISKILDKMKISFEKDQLKDPKTRLKEIFDGSKNLNGLKYVVIHTRTEENIRFKIHVVAIFSGKETVMGEGSATIKKQGEKIAAQNAINWLKRRNLIE